MAGYLSNRLGSAAFFLFLFTILSAGCNHARSKNDGNTTASSVVSRVSQALVGKRITIRGKLITCKCGQCIELEDEEVVCLEDMVAKTVLDDPYAGMYDRPVEATGTLKFFHNPTPVDETEQRNEDHYYFDREVTQVRLATK